MTVPSPRASASEVATALRDAIASGVWSPGERLPTTAALRVRFNASAPVISKAIQQLKAAGLLSGVAGGRTSVRVQPVHFVRSNRGYHEEKAAVLLSESERRLRGVSERSAGIPVDEIPDDLVDYDRVGADDAVAFRLNIERGTPVLRRIYTRRYRDNSGLSRSFSYIPLSLISGNPELLDRDMEPWPGGTLHQLYTVGIDVVRIVDRVTASMPTPEESEDYDVPPGVPMVRIEKISYDLDDRPVEISFIPVPADRVDLLYTTDLEKLT